MKPGEAGAVCEACAIGLPGASALARDLASRSSGDPGRLRLLRFGPQSLIDAQRWDELEAVLTDLSFLEAKASVGLAYDLLDDFTQALRHLPARRPVRRILALLDEALRRDMHFLVRFPAALFPCLWNSGWWYDAPGAAAYYDPPEGGWPAEGPPWTRRPRLAPLLESWHRAREERTPGLPWLRSLRPPNLPLGSAQRTLIDIDTEHWRCLNLSFSPDGTRLFAWLRPFVPFGPESRQLGTSGSESRQLRAWEIASGREVKDFAEGDIPSSDPTVSLDGRWRVQSGGPEGGWGQPVRLSNAAHGTKTISLPTDADINIRETAFSASGERLIGGGYGDDGVGVVLVWEVASGRRLACLCAADSVSAVALSFDGQRAVTGTSEGAIDVWDIEAGVVSATLGGHESAVQALAFAADTRQLASASYDGTIRVWDLERVTPLPRLKGHPDSILDVVFSTDDRRLITTSTNRTTWLWDGESGQPIACPYRSNFVVHSGGPPQNCVYADERRVISLACVITWDAETGSVIHANREEERCRFFNRPIVWAPDGRLFATLGHHGRIEIGDPERPVQITCLKGYDGDVNCLAFSPDGRRLVSGSDDQMVRVWDAVTGTPITLLRGHEGAITCVAFSPEGGRIVSAAADRTVRVWDWEGEEELACLRIEDPGVWSHGWSRDGGCWEVHALSAVAFSADGKHVLTLSERDRIRVFDPATGLCLRTLQGVGNFKAVAASSPWQAFLRGGVLEVESSAGEVIARVPYPRGLIPPQPPVTRPDGQAWAGALGRRLYFFALCGRSPQQMTGGA
jgi:WD40 repeat protein